MGPCTTRKPMILLRVTVYVHVRDVTISYTVGNKGSSISHAV